MTRPTIRKGSTGPHVVTVQECLDAEPIDGDFGSITETAVKEYQQTERIDVDGVVGPDTWSHLEKDFDLPPYPAPMPEPLTAEQIASIRSIARNSPIARYHWDDRGVAPDGYTEGFALAFAYVCKKWFLKDPTALEQAQANTHDSDVDALSWYAGFFRDLNMPNETNGIDTLRHLWALMMGLGMRESSGR